MMLSYHNQEKKELELESSGIIQCEILKWIYGTGCAEPILSIILNRINLEIQMGKPKYGYNKAKIPKGKLGKFSKIKEEVLELEDTLDQNNQIMALVELSDISGRLRLFVLTI